MAKNQTVPSDWDDLQQVVIDSYNDGDHPAHTPKDIHDCGDTLLTFLLVEISRQEDCDSIGCAINRLDTAIRQLTQVRAAFGAKELEASDPANVFGEQLWIGDIGVAFADIGEGRNGDYNPEDPEDEALLRLDFMQKDEGGEFVDTDGSGCTNVSVSATKEERQRFLELAMAHAQKHIIRDKSTNFKMLCGALTWMSKDWDGALGNHATPDEVPAILAKYPLAE
ncbi:MAG: hypothetical protein KJZ90_00875 [Rhodocyclaceae bacterium]|nr:hypothetical protein [Rhodocyclaceae bacterium]